MRRILALLCALALSASLTACRGGNRLADEAKRAGEQAGDDLREARDDLESDLDRMIDNGDLTDKR